MLQGISSLPSKCKLLTFSPPTSSPRTPTTLSNLPSSSSSSPLPSSDLDYHAILPWDRRHSSSSTATTSDASEDELETPPTSPRPQTISLPDLSHPDEKSIHSKPVDLLHYPFSIAEICDEDESPSFDWITPSDSSNLPQLLPSASQSPPNIALPSFSPAPITPSTPSSVRSLANRPSRQEEESSRGRSRAPRLLWRSEIDKPSMDVLNRYHEDVAGVSMPRLEKGMGRRQVREWSKRVEEAGI
ncbi:hypothetical protein JCM5353_006406 [Sporobolomyces roseus]